MIRNGTLWQTDCLDLMQRSEPDCVDLLYMDPPFASGRDYAGEAGKFTDRWESLGDYLDYMEARIKAARHVLAPTGSIYLHCDDTACHRLRCILDDVFGTAAFRSQITWKRSNPKNNATKAFGRVSDIILHYAGASADHNPQFAPPDKEIAKRFPHIDDDGRRYNTDTPLFRAPSMGPRPNLCYVYNGVENPHASGWRVSRQRLAELDAAGEIIWREGKRPLRKKFADGYAGKQIGNIWDDIDPVFSPQFTPLDSEYVHKFYCHDDGDGRGPWRRSPIDSPEANGYHYDYKGYAPPAKGWRCPEETMRQLDAEGRLHFPAKKSGRISRKRYLSESKGTPVGNLWDDIGGLQHASAEMLGYPTQKPLALLERIVAASSNPGDLVFDPFMGSGTTLMAAKRLGREWCGCDVSADALACARERLEGELL